MSTPPRLTHDDLLAKGIQYIRSVPGARYVISLPDGRLLGDSSLANPPAPAASAKKRVAVYNHIKKHDYIVLVMSANPGETLPLFECSNHAEADSLRSSIASWRIRSGVHCDIQCSTIYDATHWVSVTVLAAPVKSIQSELIPS